MKQKNKKDFQPIKVAMATGGGMAGFMLMYQLEKRIQKLKENPKITPAINIAVATGLDYFTGGKYEPFCHGMMGAGGSDLLMQFMSKSATADKNFQQQGIQEQAEENIRQAEVMVQREMNTEPTEIIRDDNEEINVSNDWDDDDDDDDDEELLT